MQLFQSILATVISYSAFPLLFAALRRSPITSKRYRIYCYLFNFAANVLLSTVGVFAPSPNIMPMLIWTYVASIFGKKILASHSALSE